MDYQQLELSLDVKACSNFSAIYDIVWDKSDTHSPPYALKSVREQVDFDTDSSNIVVERDDLPKGVSDSSPQPLQNLHHSNHPSRGINRLVAPEHNQSVREQHFDESAPEHKHGSCKGFVESAPEHKQLGIQWVEEYWVRRSGKEHYYYRFCWMEGRKIRHKHIGGGNVKTPAAIYRKLIVEANLGRATHEIVTLINSFKNA